MPVPALLASALLPALECWLSGVRLKSVPIDRFAWHGSVAVALWTLAARLPLWIMGYPRILAPCAHTFCTQCIERQLKARGANFRCLLHNSAVVGVVKATDVKAKFRAH
jgi:hypothetical protein